MKTRVPGMGSIPTRSPTTPYASTLKLSGILFASFGTLSFGFKLSVMGALTCTDQTEIVLTRIPTL